MPVKKYRIDSSTTALIKRAARSQADSGLNEIIVNGANIQRKKRDLATLRLRSSKRKIYRSLEEHNQDVCKCQKCPLGATRTRFVYGVGNPKAKVIFIGEAPGRDEDLQGEPFVGRAGQLLDRILAAVKFTREEVYIANILKCRPPGNRDPQPDEMATCLPYLLEQIRLIKPQIICALGRISAQALLQTTTPIGKLRKVWHEFQGIPLLVTYHPAALLRFPAYKRDVWEDVQILRTRYDELPEKKR